MGRKTYISFKTEDESYKEQIQDMDIDYVDKSLNTPINSVDDDYIMRRIREDYLSDSTVTIFLIGAQSAEAMGAQEQRYIKRELQASLYNGAANTKNGILGLVLPHVEDRVYGGEYECWRCSNKHNSISINDQTVVKEFSYNYYLPNDKCSHSEDERYCVLTRWSDFISAPERYIERAFAKRSAPIAEKTKVRP